MKKYTAILLPKKQGKDVSQHPSPNKLMRKLSTIFSLYRRFLFSIGPEVTPLATMAVAECVATTIAIASYRNLSSTGSQHQ